MRIALGSDHAGYPLKETVKAILDEMKIEYKDFGAYSPESVDYPDYAHEVSKAVARGEFDRGILVCGTGIGMSIVANKVRGIRAALCNDIFSAKASREHNDANVLCLGARIVGPGVAEEIVKTWLTTEFAGGRHARRVEKIGEVERAERPCQL